MFNASSSNWNGKMQKQNHNLTDKPINKLLKLSMYSNQQHAIINYSDSQQRIWILNVRQNARNSAGDYYSSSCCVGCVYVVVIVSLSRAIIFISFAMFGIFCANSYECCKLCCVIRTHCQEIEYLNISLCSWRPSVPRSCVCAVCALLLNVFGDIYRESSPIPCWINN